MIVRRLWNFGTGRYSTEANPVYYYRMAGSYTVILTVWDETGASSTIIETNLIIASEADVTIQGFPVRRTNRCFRYANKPTQGVGWSEYTGNFPFPETRVGTLKLMDDNNNVRLLAPDSRTGSFYEIGTRNGPDGSGLTKVFRDLITAYQSYDIAATIVLKEHRGAYEHYRIQHQEGHFYFRPYEETDRNRTGYGANGYLTGFEVDISAYVDGELVDRAETKDIPLTGDITYQRKVQGKRIATQIDTNMSSWKMVETNQYYNQKDMRGSVLEITMSEHSWESQLSSGLLLWLSRSATPTVNRVTGTALTGSFASQGTGPERSLNFPAQTKTNTSMVYAAADQLSTTLATLDGDFSVIFWVRSLANATTEVLEYGAGTFVIDISGTNLLVYDAVDTTTSSALPWTGANWVAIMVVRSGSDILLYANGVLLNTNPFTAIRDYGTVPVIMGSNAVGELSTDFRIYDKAISADAFLFYYEDMLQNLGDAVCPTW